MSWDMPWGYIVTCVLCTTFAVVYYNLVSSKRPDENPGPFAISLALILFLAAINVFF